MGRNRLLLATVLSVMLCLSLFASVKAEAAMWTQTYGGADSDIGRSVVETSDGGYAVAGSTASFGTGGSDDFYLVKTDANGNMLWNKTYGGTNNEFCSSVVQTSDEGYAIVGRTFSFGADANDFYLGRTDANGNMLWNKTYGGALWDYASSVIETVDGGYVIAGETESFGTGSRDIWLVKTDSAGSMLWNKTYGGASVDVGFSVVQTSDGGYAVAGSTASFGAGIEDFYLVKTDANGNMLWNKTYGGTGRDLGYSVVQTSDGGYAVAGRTSSFGTGGSDDFYLVKTDANGNMLWNKTYGGTNNEAGYSVVQTSDGSYAVAGETESFGTGGYDFWLVKTDSAGSMLWNKTYGGTNNEYCSSLVATSDEGYVLAGTTTSFGAGLMDVWLVKTDEYGVVPEAAWVILPLLVIATVSILISKKKLLLKRS